MKDWLKARVESTPDSLALRMGADIALTFAELDQQVNAACVFLQDAGLAAGDHLGLLLDNSLDAVALVFAAMRCQLVLVPLNTRLSPTEISQQLERADCALLLTDADRADAIRPSTRVPVRTVAIEPTTRIIPAPHIDLDAVAAIFHTSGTSGQPKGACLTYGNIFYSAMASAYRIGVLPHDRWLCVLPLYHVGGMSVILRYVLYGTAVDLHPRFELDAVNHALTHDPVTLVSLVPTMLHRLLEVRTQPWNPDFRLVLLGGAAPTEQLMQRCTEDSQVATALPDQVIQKPESVGLPLLFSSVRVIDEQGTDLPRGEYGQIVVSGPTIMAGYYRDEVATQKTLINGELHTGDIGFLDGDGALSVVQRRTDLIVTGGENVYPAEVEAVLLRHPSVVQAVVVGAGDAEWGQRVAAVIQLHDAQSALSAELDQWCRQSLAGYKCPRTYHFVDEIPLTASGKVNRFAIREQYT